MKRQIIAAALIVLSSLVGSSWASEFAEDFESYSVWAGMHGQGGWKGWNNASAADAMISNLYSYSGRQSVEILGASDLVHEFRLSGGKWVLTAMQYIPSESRGSTYFILLNTYNDGGPHDWSVQTEFNLETGAITPFGGATGSGTRIVYDQWIEIREVIDLTANTVEEYYNDVLIATREWDDTANGTLQAIDLYGNAASSVFYDDIKIDSGAVSSGGSCFPRPAYDSGWVVTPFGSPSLLYTVTLRHDLRGDPDNYFVDLQRQLSGIAGPNLTNQGLGTTFSYSFLTANTIAISAPYSAVDLVTGVRVRIWTYDCDTDSGAGEPKGE